MNYNEFIKILECEMVESVGCTDPSSIAYVAATAKQYVPESDFRIEAYITPNLIKNVSAVVIPGTKDLYGAKNAAALGAICGDPKLELAGLTDVTDNQILQAKKIVNEGKVHLNVADSVERLYIKIVLSSAKHVAEVELKKEYNNIFSIKVDGKWILKNESSDTNEKDFSYDFNVLSLKNILDFTENVPIKNLYHVKRAIELNVKIAEDGLQNPYGIESGRCIKKTFSNRKSKNNISKCSSMWVAAGIDARMGGSPLPAMSNAGSGNEGIACTNSIYGASLMLGSSEEKMIRATTLSSLVAIYIKKQIGNLATICSGIIAGVGFGCGLVYLYGGGVHEMINVIKNMFGNLTAIICDGAKASCALKLASCTEAAVLAANLAMDNIALPANNGMVGHGEYDSIRYFVRCAGEGLAAMDHVVIDIILNKENDENS